MEYLVADGVGPFLSVVDVVGFVGQHFVDGLVGFSLHQVSDVAEHRFSVFGHVYGKCAQIRAKGVYGSGLTKVANWFCQIKIYKDCCTNGCDDCFGGWSYGRDGRNDFPALVTILSNMLQFMYKMHVQKWIWPYFQPNHQKSMSYCHLVFECDQLCFYKQFHIKQQAWGALLVPADQSQMSGKEYELIHKTLDILLQALGSVKQMAEQYAKMAEHQRKLKENRERPPRVHFDNEIQQPLNNYREGVRPNGITSKFNQPAQKDIQPAEKPGKVDQKQLINGTDKHNVSDKNVIKPESVKHASKSSWKGVEKENHISKKSSKEAKEQRQGEKKAEKSKAPDKTETKVNGDRPGKIKPAHIDKPKMPMSAFLRFNHTMKDKVKREYPQLTQTDLVTVTGHMWKELPEEEKSKFEEEYKREREKYDAAMIEYYRRYPEQKTKKQLNIQRKEKK